MANARLDKGLADLATVASGHEDELEIRISSSSYIQYIFKNLVFWGPRVAIFFSNSIFNLKGNCVLRTLENSFAIF